MHAHSTKLKLIMINCDKKIRCLTSDGDNLLGKNASNLICHILLALNNSRAAEVKQTLRWLISDDDNIAKKRRHQAELGNDQLQHFRFPQSLNLGDSRFPLGLIPSNVRFQRASNPAI